MSQNGPTLVTGAAGFAGSHLVARLRTGDSHIECWHHPAGGPPRAPQTHTGARVGWQPVDLLDVAAVNDAMARLRPTRIYHLAGAADQGRSWERSTEALHVNAFGTHVLLDAAARLETGCRVLVTGSAAIYAAGADVLREDSPIDPTSPYALSKLAQELVARHAGMTSGLEVVVCRPFNHIGPGQSPQFAAANFARQIAAIVGGQAPPVLRVGNLSARRDLTDVRDTVRAYELLMRGADAREVYNVCSGRAFEMRAILDGLIAHSGIGVEVETAPELLRPVDRPLLVGSFDKLHAATGWTPDIPIDQTLRDLLDATLGTDAASDE